MATRLTLPKLPRIRVDLDPRATLESWRRAVVRRPPRGAALHQLIWRIAWAPYWVASDVPAPHLPARDRPAPAAGLAGDQVAREIDRIARRVWLQRALTILVRSCWLGLLVGCVWMAIELGGGLPLDVGVLLRIAIVLAPPGFVFAALVRPTRRQVARMLDRSFGLQERMGTAVDNLGRAVPTEGERASVVYLQMADAANVVAGLRTHAALKLRPPVRELVMAVGCGLLLATLLFLRGVGGAIPRAKANAVPPFKSAAERLVDQEQSAAAVGSPVPTTAQVQERVRRSNEARRDLQTLAKALNDHAVTKAAADAIQRGDYQAAANDLRDLAAKADQLSSAERQGLAQDLNAAASQMSPGSKALSDAAQQAANGLQQGKDQAKDGIRKLGDAVQDTGKDVASQQQLAQEMQQARQADAQRGNAGQQGSAGQPNQGNGQPPSNGAPDSQNQSGAQAGSQQSGQQGNGGQGTNAQPGQGKDPGQQAAGQNGRQPSGNPQQGGQPGQGQPSGDPGSGNRPDRQGTGAQPGQTQDNQPGQSGQPSGNQQSQGAQQGAGAGTGHEAGKSGQNANGQPSNGQQPGSQQPPDKNVTQGNGQQGQGQATNGQSSSRDAVVLPRAPDGQGVQTGGDSGASSVGSGAGMTVSGGTNVQGNVGPAGPDSNRVPPAYRSVVEAYFSDARHP